MDLPTIQQIKTKNFTWTDISQCSSEGMKYLEQNFKFHPVHLSDCLSKIQQPKLDITSKYVFLVLLFPVYNRRTRKVTSSELDFFISSDYLITVHRSELLPLINFFNFCKVGKSEQEKNSFDNPVFLVYEILNRLFSSCVPILDSLDLNITSIEEHIFKGYEKKMVREILIAKTNIVNFRKIMQAHRMVISKFLKKGYALLSSEKLKIYFHELLETTDDIWETLENLRQAIEATEKTNNSLISFQLNDAIKILTTISVIILPITLIASIFGMNLKFMPLTDKTFSFWTIIGLMTVTFTGLVYYFKKKKWL